jgi:hypothetical protein
MRSENVALLLALVALVWWLRQPAPAIPSVVTSSQWWDPVLGEWREF